MSWSRSTRKKPRYRVVWPVEPPISGPRMSNARGAFWVPAARARHLQVALTLDLEKADCDPDRVLVRPHRGQVHRLLQHLGAEVGVLRLVDDRHGPRRECGASRSVRFICAQGTVLASPVRATWAVAAASVPLGTQNRFTTLSFTL